MQKDRTDAVIKSGNDPLGFAKRVCQQNDVPALLAALLSPTIDVIAKLRGISPPKHGHAEGAFRNERMTGDKFERCACRVRRCLIDSAYDPHFAVMLDPDLA